MGKHFERQDRRGGYRSDVGEHERSQRNYLRDEGGNGQRRERAPLVWADVKRATSGSIVGVVSEAKLDNGDTRRSFKIGREVPDRDGGAARIMPHVGERDIPDYQKVYNDLMRWFSENGSKAD